MERNDTGTVQCEIAQAKWVEVHASCSKRDDGRVVVMEIPNEGS